MRQNPENVHVCLVSHQAAANLLPTQDPELKPERVVLVVTRAMKRQAENLKIVFGESGIAVEQFELSDEQRFDCIEDELVELATRLEGQNVSLNITGGTKLMSVAAQSVAQSADWRMFYVSVDTDEVIWVGNKESERRRLQEQLRLRHYLRSYGFEIASEVTQASVLPEQQDLMQTLVSQVASLEDALTMLNGLAQDAENRKKTSVQMDKWQLDSLSLNTLLRHFSQAGMLNVQGEKIKFVNEQARDFVKGGWLELYAMRTVNQLSGELTIRDKALNLQVQEVGEQTRNELDIAFMARNRLFVMECKTGRIDRPRGHASHPEPPKANDALFKLSANCRRMGGIGTRGMLLSYRKLGPAELQLAASLSIKVVAGRQLNQLEAEIKKWVHPDV